MLSALARAASSSTGRSLIKSGTKHLMNRITRRAKESEKRRTPPAKAIKKTETSDIHSGGDTRNVRIVLKRVPRSNRNSPLTEYYGYSFKVTGAAGEQACNYWINGGTAQHFIENSSGVFGPPIAYFSMNPNQRITGSADSTGAVVWNAGRVPPSDKVTLVRSRYTVNVSNFSSTVLYMTVYVVVCKQKTDISGLAAWSEGLQEQQDGNYLAEAFPAAGSTTATVGFPSIAHVGVHPRASRRFNQFWKIVKAFNVTLAGAANERINFSVERNKTVTREYIDSMIDDGERYMPGFVGVFAVTHAQPVYDVTVPETGIVTFGTVDYGCIVNVRDDIMCGTYQKRSKMNLAITKYSTNASAANLRQIDTEDVVIPQQTL